MAYPDNLRALSIAGPFAWEIGTGRKPVERRSWPISSYRGAVLLHNSLTRDLDDIWEDYIEFGDISRQQAMNMKGCIIGFAFLIDCDDYGHKDYGHIMDAPALFSKPVPCPGARNYWRPRKPEQVRAFEEAWGLIRTHQYRAADQYATDNYLSGFELPVEPRRILITPPPAP